MTLREEKAADLANILDVVGEPVIWQGNTYQALISEPTISQELNVGGFTETGDFTIKIMRSALTGATPQLGELIGFQSQDYRITRVTDHPQFPMIVLVVSPVE
jgi:hypothetical protein